MLRIFLRLTVIAGFVTSALVKDGMLMMDTSTLLLPFRTPATRITARVGWYGGMVNANAKAKASFPATCRG